MSDGPSGAVQLPLQGLRVVDLTDGAAASATRFLGDLGATVVLVEPLGGLPSRRDQPQHHGVGLRFATGHANKLGIALDLTQSQDRRRLFNLTDRAHIVVESFPPGHLAALGLGEAIMRGRNRALVVASITAFGQYGPYSAWRGGETVQMAMSSALTRSGAPDREPLLPPGDFASQTGAVQAAYAALLAHYRSLDTGYGDYVDCSLHEMAVQGLDPPFGMSGTATMGRAIAKLPPGRPDTRMLYPIFACADGHVRMCMLAPKHWRAMFEWLGRPERFADASFDNLSTRFAHWGEIAPAIVELCAPRTGADLIALGTELGIPIAALSTPAEAAASDHVMGRRAFVQAEVAPGLWGRMANGYVEFDGHRAGFRHRAPTIGEHDDELSAAMFEEFDHTEAGLPGPATRPLDGLRVLDLGVIVVGAETGRLLADQGADVIKVESREFPDGARLSGSTSRVSVPFAGGNRGKRSIGLNLRKPQGVNIFRHLVAESDVVLTNFKPGTMESLGFDYASLREINPRIVVVDSSALGNSGPWSKRMGYGPLVRATVGLTTLWRHPDSPEAFGDDMTVYPDHAAARVAVAAIVAALIGRRRNGFGTRISIAQMDTVFNQLATEYLRDSVQPGTMIARGNSGEFDAPHGLFPCVGEDAYCVVAVDGDVDWMNLANAIGRSDLAARPELGTAVGRVARRAEIDAAVVEWTATRDARDAASLLQSHGIAAGAALHARDLLSDPQLLARRHFGALQQPGWAEPIATEAGPALFESIPPPELRPAPHMGEHTLQICRDLLGLTNAEVDELVELGVIEPADEHADQVTR